MSCAGKVAGVASVVVMSEAEVERGEGVWRYRPSRMASARGQVVVKSIVKSSGGVVRVQPRD